MRPSLKRTRPRRAGPSTASAPVRREFSRTCMASKMLTVERSPAKVTGRGAEGAGRGRRGRCLLEVRAARAADGFEAGRDVEARVDVLGFEQALVRRVEVLARDVEVDEDEALARGLFGQAVREGDLAQLLAQDD